MTPAWYVEVVVAPTVREFQAEPDDNRLAYLSAIATYHVVDYLMRANLPFDANQKARSDEIRRIKALLTGNRAVALRIVEALCPGTKHCGCDRGPSLTAGDEEEIPAFAADTEGAGADQARPDRPGLQVLIGGRGWFVDECLVSVLRGYRDAFPEHLGSIALPTYPD